MAFHIFTTQRVSCFGQYNRIDDFIPFNLCGDKRPVFRQFLVDEFHFSAVCKCFDPLFVWHFRISSGEINVSSSSLDAPKTACQCFHRRNSAHTTTRAAEEEADATTACSPRAYLALSAQRLGSLPLS